MKDKAQSKVQGKMQRAIKEEAVESKIIRINTEQTYEQKKQIRIMISKNK